MTTWAEINEMRGPRPTPSQRMADLREEFESFAEGTVEQLRCTSTENVAAWIQELEDSLRWAKRIKADMDELEWAFA